MSANGSQSSQIKAILDKSYANMVTESNNKRFTGIIVGSVVGVFLGTLTKQNAVVIGLIGGVIGYVTSLRK
jgi:uncharacterized membrane protein